VTQQQKLDNLHVYFAKGLLGFKLGDVVSKKSGAQWEGKIVGFYSTDLTVAGYAVESNSHKGSVQIYPETALERVKKATGI
jgi:dihydrofolate reductase (trimethoprim resistance protein)